MGDALQRLRDWNAEIAIVLGSVLNAVIRNPVESIAYSEFSELPKPRVAGHAEKFSLCEISETRVIFAQGRVHLYEGYSAGQVTANVRKLAHAGIKKLVVTNAAGALNQKFKPGDWMMINDHLNLTGTSPLIGCPEFLDLSDTYSPRLQKHFGDRSDGAFTVVFSVRSSSDPALQARLQRVDEQPAQIRVCRPRGMAACARFAS